MLYITTNKHYFYQTKTFYLNGVLGKLAFFLINAADRNQKVKVMNCFSSIKNEFSFAHFWQNESTHCNKTQVSDDTSRKSNSWWQLLILWFFVLVSRPRIILRLRTTHTGSCIFSRHLNLHLTHTQHRHTAAFSLHWSLVKNHHVIQTNKWPCLKRKLYRKLQSYWWAKLTKKQNCEIISETGCKSEILVSLLFTGIFQTLTTALVTRPKPDQ